MAIGESLRDTTPRTGWNSRARLSLIGVFVGAAAVCSVVYALQAGWPAREVLIAQATWDQAEDAQTPRFNRETLRQSMKYAAENPGNPVFAVEEVKGIGLCIPVIFRGNLTQADITRASLQIDEFSHSMALVPVDRIDEFVTLPNLELAVVQRP